MAANLAKLKGKLTYAGTPSKPIEGALVQVLEGTTKKGEATTGADGSYEIGGLEKDKTYNLKISVNGNEVYSGEVTVADAATTTKDISIETSFGNLTALIKQPGFTKDKAVEINEAVEFRRLFRVGNLILADVVQAVENLNNLLTSKPTDIGLTISNKEDLLDKHGDSINSILQRRADEFNNEETLLREVRRQFDLGTSSVEGVNIDFKTIYREYIDLCGDDLLSINPATVDKSSFGPDKEEELYELLRKLKRIIIKLTGNMSVAGTLGTRSLTVKWSSILHDSLVVLDKVASNYVPYDDTDKRHVWYVTAALNGKQKSEIDPYIVQANEGAAMLYLAIKIYDKIKNELKHEDRDHLKKLFHEDKFPVENDPSKEETASKLLRDTVNIVSENWIPDWL